MLAIAPTTVPSQPSPDADLEAFLWEQVEALVDELFHRCYRPNQRIWTESQCPWHRRLAEIGMAHIDCPICSQINRSRRAPLVNLRGRPAGAQKGDP